MHMNELIVWAYEKIFAWNCMCVGILIYVIYATLKVKPLFEVNVREGTS